MPDPVFNAVITHLERERSYGGYEAADQAQDEIDNFYRQMARLFNCDIDEIAFMENATAAWNSVFYGFARTLNAGDKILTANAEYASNYIAYLHATSFSGCEIVVAPDDENGQIDVDALENMIDERVKLISISHVPTSGGLVNPAAEVGRIAAGSGIPYLLDTCQSAGQMPLDVRELKCDAMTCTGRKYLRGPRGTGALYLRRSAMERFPPATLDLWGAHWSEKDQITLADGARRYENFENNVAGQIGLGAAAAYALDLGMDVIYARITSLADRLRERLADLNGVRVLDTGTDRCGIVSFDCAGQKPAEVQARLRKRGINVGVSNRASTRLDLESRNIHSLLRASVHYFNTGSELDRFLGVLQSEIRS